MFRCLAWSFIAVACVAPAGAQSPGQQLPPIPSCPTGNCPIKPEVGNGGPILSSQVIQATTTQGSTIGEFMSNLGFYVASGKGGGQKVTQYLGLMQGHGAGVGWTLNTDIVRGACPGGPFSLNGLPGSGIPFGSPGCPYPPGDIGRDGTIGYELDLTNWDQDAAPGGPFVVGEFISTLSQFTSLAGIYYGHVPAQTVPSWHAGVYFSGGTAKDDTIHDESGASIGYHATGPHALAAFEDDSTGETSILINGQHSSQSIGDHAKTPAALNLAGSYALAAITTENATTPNALIAKEGQNVCFAGVDACVSARNGKLAYQVGGEVLFSIDRQGNAVFRGSVKQNAVP